MTPPTTASASRHSSVSDLARRVVGESPAVVSGDARVGRAARGRHRSSRAPGGRPAPQPCRNSPGAARPRRRPRPGSRGRCEHSGGRAHHAVTIGAVTARAPGRRHRGGDTRPRCRQRRGRRCEAPHAAGVPHEQLQHLPRLLGHVRRRRARRSRRRASRARHEGLRRREPRKRPQVGTGHQRAVGHVLRRVGCVRRARRAVLRADRRRVRHRAR